MNSLFNIWMLPILFILHDFEEIIFVPLWKKKHQQALEKLKTPFFGATTNGSAFATGVLEEFVILLLISAICQMTQNDLLYLSFVLAYTSHFIMHYVMCFKFKGYVPGVVTVTLQIPLILLIITHYWHVIYSIPVFIMSLVLTMAVVYANLVIMHRIMPKIQYIMEDYTK